MNYFEEPSPQWRTEENILVEIQDINGSLMLLTSLTRLSVELLR
jgi:hypothetical protein